MTDVIKHVWPDLNTRDCKHGQLSRSCDICSLESENAELKAENERLRIALVELERLAREALGG